MALVRGTGTLLLVLQVILSTTGTPSLRSYNVLNEYVYYPDRTYVTNPYEGGVYVTDMYGRTSYAGTTSTYRAPTYSPQYSRARAVNYYNYYSGCRTGLCRQVSLPQSQGTSCNTGLCRQTSLPEPHITTCNGATCGNNAHCTTIGGRAVCSCLRGYIGDPLFNCIRAECLDDSECRSHQTCRNERCVDPCAGVCGDNANCETRNHVPICSCPPGYTGDPFSRCRRFNPEELCHPTPCGQNTQCEVINEIPTCKCLPGYHGSPLAGCRHECESNAECGSQMACIEFKCQNPCSQCGTNAECDFVQSHVPLCKCPRGYYGNPSISCQPECTTHSDCPPGKPACFANSCKNPCDGVCGTNANCEVRNGITPVCFCPKDMTGDPFVSCRPFTKEDLCEPNPCGANAKCTPGYDRSNNERPVCTCYPGYLGDALSGCVRGECIDDNECADHLACFDYKCQNPCRNQCGVNAMCNPRRHIAVCTCHNGFNGDALTHCHPVETTAVSSRLVSCNYC